jgi:hypothetical protein
MGIRLLRLLASGPNKQIAIIKFTEKATLIYGPSDTGKSHIFKAINYLLGSDSVPSVDLTEGQGYDVFGLEVENTKTNERYTIVRGTAGGGESVHSGTFENRSQDSILQTNAGELLKFLAGVQSNIIYRKSGTTGAVTPGSLRHWCLLSENRIGQDTTVLGDTIDRTTNAAAVSLLITGNDDSGIQPGFSSVDKERARGGKEAIELTIARLNADIPDGTALVELKESLSRVDRVLTEMDGLHLSRSSRLKITREQVSVTSQNLRHLESKLAQHSGMLERFLLLDEKYKNDLSRLVAVDEGIAFFDLLDEVPCPLCGVLLSPGMESYHNHGKSSELQRIALAAEASKIQKLQSDLTLAIASEREHIQNFALHRAEQLQRLDLLEKEEKVQIQNASEEFAHSPAEMAERRSILYSQISAFEEIDRLKAEADRLGTLSKTKAAAIARAFGDNADKLSTRILNLLHDWGFESIQSISFDTKDYDIRIDNRRRLSFGMGTRSVFMTAFAIAIMEHSLSIKAPHPGVLVIDSPLKTYYEKRKSDDPSVELVTVRDRFYKWFAGWQGEGQIVILENAIPSKSTRSEEWTEFTDDDEIGRQGFYPKAVGDNSDLFQ